MIPKDLGRRVIEVCKRFLFSIFKINATGKKPCLTAVCETLIFENDCRSLLNMVLEKWSTADFGMIFSHPKLKDEIERFKPINISNRYLTTKKIESSDSSSILKMKCSICNQEGYNKRSCKTMATSVSEVKIEAETDVKKKALVKVEMTSERKEVQAHGFSWEKEIICNVYRAKNEELKEIKYNSKMDLPAKLNRLDECDISVKTSCSQNAVCMADCLRVFDAVSSGKPIHMVVVHYVQDDASIKKITTITEVDLTNSRDLLFGSLTRSQIEELDKVVKSVPQKRKPTEEEYNKMYSLRDDLQKSSGAIHLDIKCNSTQSRLQCSLNRFQQFVEKNSEKIVAKSNTNEFRGGTISSQIISSRRVFKKKQTV
jgi:hypothetical protein